MKLQSLKASTYIQQVMLISVYASDKINKKVICLD